MALQDSSKFGKVGAGGVILRILLSGLVLFSFIGIEISINQSIIYFNSLRRGAKKARSKY